MLDKVRRYMEKYHMIHENDKIVVGVSGGADSVCLLFVLLEIKKEIPISLYVVHINHKIREEAMEDADYVKSICEQEQIPYYLVEEDVEALAKSEHLSSEEAGRKVRYEAFQKVMAEVKGNKIAVAHNRNDRAETVLFNLLRGSSIRGLNGIAPVREEIIRPLLCVERKEIEAYLREREIPYCIDKTNAEDTYTRNRIRNHLLPYMEAHISENVVSHISDTAEMMAETEAYLQKMTQMSYEKLVTAKVSDGINNEISNEINNQVSNEISNEISNQVNEKTGNKVSAKINNKKSITGQKEAFLNTKHVFVQGNNPADYVDISTAKAEALWIDADGFKELDSILQKYLIMKCMDQIAGSRKDITSRHVQDVLELFGKNVNKKVNLPYHMVAEREYESVRITRENTMPKSLNDRTEREAFEDSACENLKGTQKETQEEVRREIQKETQEGIRREIQKEARDETTKIDLKNMREKTSEIIEIPGLGKVEIRVFPYEKSKGIPEKTYTKWFDYDKIDKSLLVRHRRTGDYLAINEQGNTKTLKTYMIHEKIPKDKRDQLYVLAVENHVVWLIGYRISQYYKVDQNTKEILEVHLVGGKENGRAR